mgnify:CR=1 FL=1
MKTGVLFSKSITFLVGVSVDGIESVHNLYRHDKNEQGTYHRIRENIKLLEKYNVEYNILTVVNRQVAENIKQITKSTEKTAGTINNISFALTSGGTARSKRIFSYT